MINLVLYDRYFGTLAFRETTKSGQVIDMEEKFNRLRQLSMLNAAWKRFDPLHVSLTKVNRQLEVLAQNPPRYVRNLASCCSS